jgi:DNA-binding MarR family transcriptional regulator
MSILVTPSLLWMTNSGGGDMSDPAWRVVLALAGAFRDAVDEVHRDLAVDGHPQARPLHGFALQAIGVEGCTINELGQRLGVSKQAAAKASVALEAAGYVTRETHPEDGRAVLVRRTAHAEDMLAASETAFEKVANGWRELLGDDDFEALARAVTRISAGRPVGDLPGWLTQRTPSERLQ